MVLICYVLKLWRVKVAAAVLNGKEHKMLQHDNSEMIPESLKVCEPEYGNLLEMRNWPERASEREARKNPKQNKPHHLVGLANDWTQLGGIGKTICLLKVCFYCCMIECTWSRKRFCLAIRKMDHTWKLWLKFVARIAVLDDTPRWGVRLWFLGIQGKDFLQFVHPFSQRNIAYKSGHRGDFFCGKVCTVFWRCFVFWRGLFQSIFYISN